MDLFKRIGTDRHKFKMQIFLKTLACNAKLKGDIYIKIKRGDHKLTSQNKVPLGQDGTCDFGKEILTFQSLTLFFDSDKKAYQEKQGEFTVVIITKKGEKKLLGSFQFDVAQYANSGKENIQVTKKFGDKIKVVLEYDVFIKCMGEASQTSKSVDKQSEPKKQSSLSKFTSLFTSNKQSPEKEVKNVSPIPKQNAEGKNKKERENSEQKNIRKQANKVTKNEDDRQEGKRGEKTTSNNLGKRIENAGSERKIAEKPKRQKNDSDEDSNETPQKQPKNLVNIRQKDKDNYTEAEQSERDLDPKTKNKKSLTPVQEPIYFDQAYKKKQAEPNMDNQVRPNKIKRTENNTINKQANEFLKKGEKSNKTNEFETNSNSSPQVIEKMSKDIQELKGKNYELEKQNKQLKTQNLKLTEERQNLSKKLQEVKSNRNNDFFQTERQPVNTKVDDQKMKSLQKEKGDLLVKIQKLEEKYKKDFQKYEEKVEQYEEQKNEMEEASKAEMKRLKEQFSEQKDKYDKLMAKYEQKVTEAKQFKQKQNDLKERLAVAQNNLSQLKLKIGDQLNEANQQGNKTVIDILTLLSQ